MFSLSGKILQVFFDTFPSGPEPIKYFPHTRRYKGPGFYSTWLESSSCYRCCPDPVKFFGTLEVSKSKILVQI